MPPATQVSAVPRRAKDVGFALGIAVLFAAAAWLGISLKRELGPVAAIWPSNGLLAAILLLRSGSDWRWTLAACFVANVVVNSLAGNTPDTAIGFSAANAVEVLIVVRVLRRSLTSMSALGDPRVLLRFFFYAVVIAPAIAAALAALVLQATVDAEFTTVFVPWWASDALGMAVVLPLAFGLQPAELRQTARDASWQTAIATIVLAIVTTVVVCAQSWFPLLFLVIPPVLLIAFRLGYAGTSAAIFVVAAIAFGFTLADRGPFAAISEPEQILALQLLIAALILTSYPVCAVVAHQRRLLHDMAESEERFRIIAVNSIDIITVTDQRGAWVYLSPSVTEMFGWTPGELIGRNGVEYVHPDDAALYSGGIELLRKGREMLAGSFRMRHRDGRYVWVETISRPLRGSGRGGSFGWVSNTRDISARKRVEQIQNEFIATINHELRTPLTAMLGSIGLAASGKFGNPDPALARLLDMARTNGDRLAQLINDILDFEKASSGKMRFDLRPFVVDELIDRCITASRYYAERLNVTLEARHRAPGSLIRVDDGRFHQIMANLLSNAAKFSRTGGRVEVDVVARDGHCRISVIDHGCGIPMAFRKKLFERFSQADTSDGRSRGGTGLGMAIAKHLTEQMSGRIAFESEENVGTTFHLEFPLVNSKADAA
ncbi:MAG TPA: MASE1 domain-containing protein [Steroidobacteraceae bacterium]|nr:MASE1 domain-containing protein [Steroidobacteraceae bacterium]